MKNLRISFLFLGAFFLLAGCFEQRNPQNPPATPQTSGDIVSEEISYYTAASGPVRGYLARPDDDGKHPGVILIHEWWGLNDDIKTKAREFASQGYVALAVDLYGGKTGTTPEEAMGLATAVRSDLPEAFRNLQSAITTLRTHASVDAERLASVGWCFGGNWAYEIAKNDLGVKVSVMYYGEMHPEDDLSSMKTLLQGHFGEKDMNIKVDTVKEFQAKLKTLSGEHEIYIYPNSGHAFANPENPNYNAEDAAAAWQRTLEFLKKHLGDPWNGKAPTGTSVPVGSFTVDPNGSWYGEVFVRGYPEVKKVKEPFCEGTNCQEYDYVSFRMLQTTNPDFKKFLDANQGNAAVGDYQVGLGCVKEERIVYENDSDQNGMKEQVLSPELSAAILQATKEKPVALKLTKLKLTGGRGAPACYSHFTTMEEMPAS